MSTIKYLVPICHIVKAKIRHFLTNLTLLNKLMFFDQFRNIPLVCDATGSFKEPYGERS